MVGRISPMHLRVSVMVAWNGKDQRRIVLVWLIELLLIEPLLSVVINHVAQHIVKVGHIGRSCVFYLIFHGCGNRFFGSRPVDTPDVAYAVEDELSCLAGCSGRFRIEDFQRSGKLIRGWIGNRNESRVLLDGSHRVAGGAARLAYCFVAGKVGSDHVRMQHGGVPPLRKSLIPADERRVAVSRLFVVADEGAEGILPSPLGSVGEMFSAVPSSPQSVRELVTQF